MYTFDYQNQRVINQKETYSTFTSESYYIGLCGLVEKNNCTLFVNFNTCRVAVLHNLKKNYPLSSQLSVGITTDVHSVKLIKWYKSTLNFWKRCDPGVIPELTHKWVTMRAKTVINFFLIYSTTRLADTPHKIYQPKWSVLCNKSNCHLEVTSVK